MTIHLCNRTNSRRRYSFCFAVLLTCMPCGAHGAQILSWPNREPYQHVGHTQGTTDMPVPAVEAARQQLCTPPSQWTVEVTRHFGQRHQLIVYLGSGLRRANFLVTPQAWCYLTDQSIDCLNRVMKRDLKTRDLGDPAKLAYYINGLETILFGNRLTLDEHFGPMHSDPADRSLWLHGREKNFDSLLRLCHRPVVFGQGDEVTITFNEVTLRGNVLRRTLHAKAGEWLELTRIDSVELRPEGTFSCPLID